MEVIVRETRDDEEVKVPVSSFIESKYVAALDYHLTCYSLRRKIIPLQRYCYVDLICYALNVTEGLQD